MKTVIYQSYRTEDVPTWIIRCMQTVKDWAQSNNFDYQFIDDRLFQYVPEWYREKVNHQIHLTSDLARLYLAKDYLSQGYDRAIWIDADVVIFDPNNFNLPIDQPYLFCREVWLHFYSENQQVTCQQNVNNSVCAFRKGNSILEFYISACEEIVKNQSRLSHDYVGTNFLTILHKAIGNPVINTVGLFSPFVTHDIAQNKGILTAIYMKVFAHPIYAANLCTTFRNTDYRGIFMSDTLYEQAIDNLLKTRGRIVNQYCPERTNLEETIAVSQNNYEDIIFSLDQDCQPIPVKLAMKPSIELAIQLHQRNHLTEAEQIYHKILETRPDDSEALYRLGVLSNQLGQVEKAEQLLTESLEIRPHSAKAWFSLGNLRQSRGQFLDAIACYRTAVDLQPDSAPIYNNFGYALQQQGNLEEALVCYREALKLQPDCTEAKVNLENALMAGGRRENL